MDDLGGKPTIFGNPHITIFRSNICSFFPSKPPSFRRSGLGFGSSTFVAEHRGWCWGDEPGSRGVLDGPILDGVGWRKKTLVKSRETRTGQQKH